jgi:TonB family protein
MIVPAILDWHFRHQRKQMITFVDFTVAVPGDTSVKAVARIEEMKKPEKAAQKPAPDSMPDTSKGKIDISKKKVKRAQVQGGTTKTSNLSMDEIKKLLEAGARISDHTSIPDNYVEVGYYTIVRQIMYDAWTQPTGLTPAGLITTVSIRVTRNGTIISRDMTKSSGNSIMDDSVMKAVNAVTKIKPLPDNFSGSTKDISIEFELARGEI